MTALCAGAATDAMPGWNLLWGNQTRPARAAFEERLTTAPGDADAGRGRILALVTEGHERAALEEMVLQSHRAGVDMRDFLLASWLEQQIATSAADQKKLQDVFQSLAGSREIAPLDRRAVLAAAANRAIANGDEGQARKLAKSLNRSDQYWLLGPFSNVSGSGFRKDILGPTPSSAETEYAGRDKLRVRWFPCPVLDLARQVDAFNHFPGHRDLCAFAGTALELSAPANVLLSVTRQGALSVQLDGTLLSEHEDPATQFELEHFEIQLPAGRHTILARLCGQSNDATLAVSLSNLDGSALDGLRWAPLFPDGLVDGSRSFQVRRLPMLESLERAVQADTTAVDQAFWLLLALEAMDCRDELREFAGQVLSRFPASVQPQFAAAGALARLGDEEALPSRLDRLGRLDEGNALVRLAAATVAIKARRLAQSDSLLSAVTANAPDCLRARLMKLGTLRQRSLDREATEAAQTLVTAWPDFSDPYDALADHAELIGKASEARKLRRQAMDRLPRTTAAIQRLASAYRGDQLAEQIRWLTPLARIYRDSPTIQMSLAVARFRSGDQDALYLINDAIEAFPYSPDAFYLKGLLVDAGLHIGMVADRGALYYFARAAELAPGNLMLRDLLRHMAGKKPVREVLPPINFEARRATPVEAKQASGQSAVILLDDVRRIVLEDGTSFDEKNLSIKILNADGVGEFGSLPLRYNSFLSDQVVYVARTVKPDGTTIDADQRPDEVAFKAVAAGDILELSYGANASDGGELGGEFWDSHLFQWSQPCMESRYTLLIPPDRTVATRLNNCRAEVRIDSSDTAQDGFRQLVWVARNVPGRPAEPLAPPARDASPWLDVSSLRAWDPIVRWYADLSEAPSKVDAIVSTRAQELTRGDRSPESKARTLYEYVSSNVAYENLDFQYSAFVPEPARAVLHALHGDCKDQVCLLKSMLSAVDVHASFALVTPNNRGVTPFLPSTRFTHAILALDLPGRRIFLDPTARGTPFGAIPGPLEGAQALVVSDRVAGLERIEPTGGVSANQFRTRIELGATREITLTRSECYHRPDDIAGLRSEMALLGPDERGRNVAMRLGAQLGRIHMTSCEWWGLEARLDSLGVTYALTADEPATTAGALRILRLPWATRFSPVFGSIVAAESRREPLDLAAARLDESEELALAIPAGWSLAAVPDPVELAGVAGELVVRFRVEGSTLRGTRRLRLSGQQIPVSDYATARDFLAAVNKAGEVSVVLQQTTH